MLALLLSLASVAPLIMLFLYYMTDQMEHWWNFPCGSADGYNSYEGR